MDFLKHAVIFVVVISSTFSHEIAKPVDSTGVNDVICPDGRHACPTGSTCCKLPTGVWGCCPIANAVCCNDHLHCCPKNTKCDTAHGRCLRGVEESTQWHEKTESRPLNATSAANDVKCDSFSTCPDGTTCCKLISGTWGCCPIPNAVCCADHQHCCPSNTICDTAHGRCTMKSGVSIGEEMTAKVHLTITKKAEKANYKTVICPDQESYCPDGSTCCLLPGGGYGCCPMPKAVCCSDHLHCCPHDSTCDLEHTTCRRRGFTSATDLIAMSEKTPASSVAALKSKEVCHDESTMCVEGHRCCITVDAEWGCCPP